MVHRPSHHLNDPVGILKKCDTFFVGPPTLLSVLKDLSPGIIQDFPDNDKQLFCQLYKSCFVCYTFFLKEINRNKYIHKHFFSPTMMRINEFMLPFGLFIEFVDKVIIVKPANSELHKNWSKVPPYTGLVDRNETRIFFFFFTQVKHEFWRRVPSPLPLSNSSKHLKINLYSGIRMYNPLLLFYFLLRNNCQTKC